MCDDTTAEKHADKSLTTPTARLFNCARCRKQSVICQQCDRGHRYCSTECARLNRQRNRAESARRYRESPAGKSANAARQARFRERQYSSTDAHQSKNVTNHGSGFFQAMLSYALVQLCSQTVIHFAAAADAPTTHRHCHWCWGPVDRFLRLGFLTTDTG